MKKESRNLLSKRKIIEYLNNKRKNKYIKDKNIFIYDKLDSTNNKAKEYLQKKINKSSEIKIILAEKQKKGRGRRGNNWVSYNQKGLWASFLFDLDMPREKIPQITVIGALTVQKTLKKYNIDSQIKWPNDVLVNGKKISGILTEMVVTDKKAVPSIIMGIGLNINQNYFAENISKTATSMYKLKGTFFDKNEVFCELYLNFAEFLDQYISGSRKKIIDSWKKELKIIGKQLELKYESKVFKVWVLDILDNGELYCKLENGQIKIFPTAGTSLNFTSYKSR
ncbi:biotin--[acetyl-CoA-carboxylase] ligase [Halanaerobium sp. MA284_MarDTE_T2]|uniref:biotin--[acetyl-CoA-carboxylase] ligase n=1 Tax=Halanaerobium sp. MA284_MarDTE_T2 TaxID=2183913 RepID=UPI000E13EAF7|nr:biotin--[acetyl-CoA-carboxylase] ligase [Halanaerobium sp. MA284_MarDTE_T2]RCW40565.1 BirA family biotin operon repressor/biotin-[acetyl-CoA-carboxylase] ligase [Halanaerobium sp. MA284_MarDTE_T2]